MIYVYRPYDKIKTNPEDSTIDSIPESTPDKVTHSGTTTSKE